MSRWGEPRATQDVDATVVADFGSEADVLKVLLDRYPSRVPDPAAFAARARIVLVVLPGHINGDANRAAPSCG